MAELNVPNYMTNRPESIADLAESSMRMAGQGQAFGANQQKMADANQFKQAFQGGQPNMQDLYRIDPERAQTYQNSQLAGQTNQMQQASTAHKLGSQIATEIVGKVQAMGLDPSAPDFQQRLDQISAPYRPLMSSATGKPDSGEPMHWDSLMALKDLTPAESQKAEIAGKVAEQQALQPGNLYAKQQEESYKLPAELAKEQRGLANNVEVERQKSMLAEPGIKAKIEIDLADKYAKESKEYKSVEEASKKIDSLLNSATSSPASTLAAATAYMKLLDPGSVVRESELGMALNAQGVFDKMGNYTNMLVNGKVLTPSQTKDFKQAATAVLQASRDTQKMVDTGYKQQAESYGLNPKNILRQYGQDKLPASNGTNQRSIESYMQEWDSLPKGATFTKPDGTQVEKP